MRARSASSLIEAFIKSWCSPSIIKNELSQNGALAEAIKVWKRNSDKEFEGVEDCMPDMFTVCESESSKAGLCDTQVQVSQSMYKLLIRNYAPCANLLALIE